MDDHRFVCMDPVSGDLQADKGHDERIAVGLPPALLTRLPGHMHQCITTFVVHPVELEHVADVPGGRTDLAVLDSGDLRVAAFEDLGDLVDGLTGGFAEAAELDAEAAALDRGTWAGWHGDPPRTVGRSAWSQELLWRVCAPAEWDRNLQLHQTSRTAMLWTRENYLSPSREGVRYGSSQGCHRFCRRTGPASPNAA